MKKLFLLILIPLMLFSQAGNDRYGTYLSTWYDTILGLTDTTLTGASSQWVQDQRGNLTPLRLSSSAVGIGGVPDSLLTVHGSSKFTSTIKLRTSDLNNAQMHFYNAGGKADIEFFKYESTDSVRVAFGMVGSPEANMMYNMKYVYDSGYIHKFWDNTRDAYWWTLNTNGAYMQYSPSTTDDSGSNDIYNDAGNMVIFSIEDGNSDEQNTGVFKRQGMQNYWGATINSNQADSDTYIMASGDTLADFDAGLKNIRFESNSIGLGGEPVDGRALQIDNNTYYDRGISFQLQKASGTVYGGVFNATGASTANYGLYATASNASTNWGLYVADGDAYFNDDVGIGTTNPDEELEIEGDLALSASGNNYLTLYGTNKSAFIGNSLSSIYVSGASASYPFDSWGNLIIQPRTSTGTPGDIVFSLGETTPTAKVVFKSSGNVGIGTASPANKLAVIDTTASQLQVTGYEGISGKNTSSGEIALGSLGYLRYVGATGDLYIDNSFNNDVGDIFLRTKTSGTPVNALTLAGTGLATFANSVIANSNYVVEGYATGRNVMRVVTLTVEAGTTPNTNLDITATADGFNIPSITNATDLTSGGGTGGSSFYLVNSSTLVMDITEVHIGVGGCVIETSDLNSSDGLSYTVKSTISAGNVVLYLQLAGSSTNQDWLTNTDAGDKLQFKFTFWTST